MKFSSTTVTTTFILTVALSTAAFASESYYGNPQPKPKNDGYSYYKREVQNKAYGYGGAKVKASYGYNGYAAPDGTVYRRDVNQDEKEGPPDANILNFVADDGDN